jgi:hypothetical protein
MKILAVLAVTSMSAAALAQAAGPTGGRAGEQICRLNGETGSRLARTRTCKTRAEWAQDRLAQRNMVDRAQTRQLNRTPDETDRAH